jgi:hypothetical protein
MGQLVSGFEDRHGYTMDRTEPTFNTEARFNHAPGRA